MLKFKKLILGLATVASLGLVALSASPASAIIGEGGCTSDYECHTGSICNYYTGQCELGCRDDGDCTIYEECNTSTNKCVDAPTASVCDAGDRNLADRVRTVAAIPNSSSLVVGNRILVSKNDSDTPYSYNCNYESGCGMNYVTSVKYTPGVCGGGQACYTEETGLNSQFDIYHSHKMLDKDSGKWYISAILGTCNYTGRKIVELTKCGC